MIFRSMIAVGALLGLAGTTIFAGDVDLEGVKCLFNPRGAAKAETAVEFNGGEVFFCCNNCKGKFEESPEEFATKANHQLVLTEQATQTNCPISGRPVNEEISVDVSGVDVGLCCNNCKGRVEDAEGDAQLEIVFSADAFEKGFEVGDDDDDDGE